MFKFLHSLITRFTYWICSHQKDFYWLDYLPDWLDRLYTVGPYKLHYLFMMSYRKKYHEWYCKYK